MVSQRCSAKLFLIVHCLIFLKKWILPQKGFHNSCSASFTLWCTSNNLPARKYSTLVKKYILVMIMISLCTYSISSPPNPLMSRTRCLNKKFSCWNDNLAELSFLFMWYLSSILYPILLHNTPLISDHIGNPVLLETGVHIYSFLFFLSLNKEMMVL